MASLTIDDYLASVRQNFRPERAAGIHAVLQWVFTGRETGTCHAVVNDGTIFAERGAHPAPDATVTADFDTWIRIVTYELDPLIAGQEGLFQVEGDVMVLMVSDTWFDHSGAQPR